MRIGISLRSTHLDTDVIVRHLTDEQDRVLDSLVRLARVRAALSDV